MSDWRPIESAPKDGSDFLACDATVGGFLHIIFYDPPEADGSGVWSTDHSIFHPNTDWCWASVESATYHKGAFTHWMPLPPPPPTGG